MNSSEVGAQNAKIGQIPADLLRSTDTLFLKFLEYCLQVDILHSW